MSATQITDVVVPSRFTPYSQQVTQEKVRLIRSGVMMTSPRMNDLLAGGGKTFDMPSFLDLDASDSTGADNVSTDTLADIQTASFENGTPTDANRGDAVPGKITATSEVAARLVRNKSWSSMGLSNELAGADPMAAIGDRVGYYWARRIQKIFIAIWKGVIADNELAPTGDDQHTQGDLVNDIKGSSFQDGVTNFSAEAFIDAQLTMGDSSDLLTALMVHSVVFARMKKNNLIDFTVDSEGKVQIPTFLGLEVIQDDGMPASSGVYESWLIGAGAAVYGESDADVPTEVHREPLAGNGGGQEILTTRRILGVHPVGHAYIQSTIPDGGPSNTNLQAAANWSRRYTERKQIPFACLRTREH